MDPQAITDRLIGLRAQLQKEIDHLIARHRDDHVQHRDGSRIDDEDLSLQDAQQIALLEARTQQRVHLDDALRRVEEGTYGSCEDCDSPISPARLRALPFAKRCITCQEQFELFEHIIHREDRDDA
jgi:DnaK suppressor protein